MITRFQNDKTFALEMDSTDPLKDFRDRFYIPLQNNGEPCIYFCGNSLGLQPKAARAHIEQELKDWERLGVDGHFHAKRPWLDYHEYLTEKTAKIVGAMPVEVVNMNSLTVNLHLMMVTFYRPTPSRHKILIERGAFPSDQYAVNSQIRFHNYDPSSSLIEMSPREGEDTIHTEDIEKKISEEGGSIALVLFGSVNYYTGQVFDIERITKAAHAKGCTVGFDLAHAAGNIILKLHEWGSDFAVWCTYKYLNAGPGSIAGCFVNERHLANSDLKRFAGWWGHDKKTRFLMGPDFQPIPSAEGWQLSNPSIIQLAALNASLEIFDEAGMDKLQKKSELLTSYLEYLIMDLNSDQIDIITPSDVSKRGCQLSVRFKQNGKRMFQKLIDYGVICDWREPDVIRLAPVPLYNSFIDVYSFVQNLKQNI
ncbi:kynureninase [bacterium]|nr:kynureninase [bacterium]